MPRGMMAIAGLAVVVLMIGVWARSGEAPRVETTYTEESSMARSALLHVEGMTCSGCEAAVRMAARRVDGVREAQASYEQSSAEVTYDPAQTTPDAIARAIAEHTGYTVRVTTPR